MITGDQAPAATPVLGAAEPADGPDRVAARLAGALVPKFADFAAIYLFDQSVRLSPQDGAPPKWLDLRRVACKETGSDHLLDLMPRGERVRWVGDSQMMACLLQGSAVHLPHLDATTADQLAARLATPGLAELLAARSVLLLPLATQHALVGAGLFVNGPDRPAFKPHDVPALEELARWAADGVQEADLHHEERLLAHLLRRETRPGLADQPDQVELGYRYLPEWESRVSRLGGDWIDAISLPGGRTALVVGDVMGHGIQTAITMSQCKTMVRTLAALDLPPAELLSRLDELVIRLGKEQGEVGELLATCVYAVYDPRTRRCRYASSGHPPPILVRPGGQAEVLSAPAGVPLGVGGVAFETHCTDVPDGSLFCLYTDGLVETGHSDIDAGIAAVAASLSGRFRCVEELCEEVLDGFDSALQQDESTLFVARMLGAPSGPGHRTISLDLAGPVRLVGRERELAEVRRLLTSARLVTITGPGGVGKSALARQVAGGGLPGFPDGVRFVDLAEVRNPHRVAAIVGQALQLPEHPPCSQVDAVVNHLRHRAMLLVLDTCEHLVDSCGQLATALLKAAPGVRIVATGRRTLRIAGEYTVVVPPLDGDDAAALFAAHQGAPASSVALDRLCAQLDGLPLAIELAAEQSRTLPVHELADQMTDRFNLLVRHSRAATPRHQSLRAAIGWSHELCTPHERLLWARLSIFTGDFGLAAVEYVCGTAPLHHDEILHLLSSLVDSSIVLRRGGVAAPSYYLPQSIREHGREYLILLREDGDLRRRYHEWRRGMISSRWGS